MREKGLEIGRDNMLQEYCNCNHFVFKLHLYSDCTSFEPNCDWITHLFIPSPLSVGYSLIHASPLPMGSFWFFCLFVSKTHFDHHVETLTPTLTTKLALHLTKHSYIHDWYIQLSQQTIPISIHLNPCPLQPFPEGNALWTQNFPTIVFDMG